MFAQGLLLEPSIHYKGIRRVPSCLEAPFKSKGSGWSAHVRGLVLGSDPRCKGFGEFARAQGCCVLSEKLLVVGAVLWGTGRLSCFLLLCGGVQWDLHWGAGSVSISFIIFRILLPDTPNTEQTSATTPPLQFPLLLKAGGGSRSSWVGRPCWRPTPSTCCWVACGACHSSRRACVRRLPHGRLRPRPLHNAHGHSDGVLRLPSPPCRGAR